MNHRLKKTNTCRSWTISGVRRLSVLDHCNTAGFTLLELLVAVSILAIVLSTIFAMFTDTIENINYTESQAEIYQMARISLDRIREDLECSLLVKTDDLSEKEEETTTEIFSGKNETMDDRDADAVSFLSTSHLSLDDADKDSGLAILAL